MIAYVLSVTQSIEISELSICKEAISYGKVVQLTVAMTEVIESLHKNRTCELVKSSKGQKIIQFK